MSDIVYIYTLSCPITFVVKYVGKTTNVRLRYNQHVSDKRQMSLVKSWIKSLKKTGLTPIMEVVDECNNDNWRLMESYWICQFRTWGFELKNMIDGGIGIGYVTNEIRAKIAKTLKGRKPPPLARLRTIKSVCKYSLDGDFIQKYDAISDTGYVGNNLTSAIKRKQSSYGFQWRFYSDSFMDNIGAYSRTPNTPNIASSARKIPVNEIDSNGVVIQTFTSISEAKDILKLDNIGAVCKGIRGHTKNRFFEYAIDKTTQ